MRKYKCGSSDPKKIVGAVGGAWLLALLATGCSPQSGTIYWNDAALSTAPEGAEVQQNVGQSAVNAALETEGNAVLVSSDEGLTEDSTSPTPDTAPRDTTNDGGAPDYLDMDGDGISDTDEGAFESSPTDTDLDGVPDFEDPDSDNDGIPDATEAGDGTVDSDGDTIPDYQDPDSDGDGIPDSTEGGSTSADQDGDGIPDYQDTDADGNGIPDGMEGSSGTTDTDDDGLPDYQDPDSDNDGIPDSTEDGDGTTDTDDDGLPDYQDPDSDNDGIPDSTEDGDGSTDTDGDGLPDYQDPDSDNDGIPDSTEDGDGSTDTDGDGLPDYQDPDSDNDGIPDSTEDGDGSTDTDGDGLPDYQDPDSDNDGIPDSTEGGGGTTDTDGDGIPDYQDPDSDDDESSVDCSTAVSSPEVLWSPNHKMTAIAISGLIDEDTGMVPQVRVTSIFQDEPVNDVGDGNTDVDGSGVNTSTASVRAERTGTPGVPGNGRVYHISFIATGHYGATCTGKVFVCVPHDKSNTTQPCIDDGPRYDSTKP